MTPTSETQRPVALVTGGGRGIGLGISQALHAEGFDLAICGVKEEDRVSSLPELRAGEGEVLYVQADIGVRSERERVVESVRSRFGRLGLLVNNAGVAPLERRDILDATEESYDRVMGINLKGSYFLTQGVARWMIEQGKGCIIFITSVSSTLVSTSRGEYCLSKAGLSMASKLWATRLAQHGIPVYEIRPGLIKTDMTEAVRDKYDKLIGQGLLRQARWGEPGDVGKAVAMLVRGELPYSTGQVLMVDGGLTLPTL